MDASIEDFSLGKKIGNGSFGDVFSGVYKSTGEKIAVKRVRKKILYQYGDYLINAFWKEIDCMKKCECENSVRLIKNFETQNNFNIVMELCDTDLLIYLNKRKSGFTVDEVRDTFRQLNNVFKIMNKNNIVHRDLKLGNIMLKYTDESKTKFIPKLSDYGFSKDLNNNYTATHLGTPATMAPEIMMNLAYNDKSDLWSIGIMMYQLHYKEIPYQGFNEQDILNKIKHNFPRKQPEDPQFRDLLNKLLVLDPEKRISWVDYFNHPFFNKKDEKPQNKEEDLYEKICDFNIGLNCDKDLYHCFIAKDKKTNKNVLIKSYKNEIINKNNQLFSEEIGKFKAFNGNENVLKLINFYIDNDRNNLVFEYVECEMLSIYSQKKEMTEKEIKKLNKKLYDSVFVFNECNFIPFIFISIHSFCIDKNGNPLVFDFGLHKLFMSDEEYSFYFLSNKSEMNNYNSNPIKTNIMNYGITLLKLYCGNELSIKDKEIVLPKGKILSDVFNNLISKCLKRNINKRSSWMSLGEDNYILDDDIGLSNIVGNDALLDNDKLQIIFDSLKNKFEFLIDYFHKFDFKKESEYLQQMEIFIVATLFEMKIIYNFFNRNIYEKPFTNQQEISFISINEDCVINKFDLNFVNPLLRDTKIINMINNKTILNFLSYLKKYIPKIEKISSKIHSHLKNSIVNGNFKQFLKNLIQNFDNSKLQEFFFSVIKKSENEKKSSKIYKELCLGEYLCEFILFIKTILYDEQEKINFTKQSLVKKFFEVFGEEKNTIEISVINLKETKKTYVLVSFIAILFKCYKGTDIFDKEKLEKNRQSINGLVRYYPSLMKRIVEIKKNM